MASKAKKVIVRSFKITNTQLSENSSGILGMLKSILTPDSTIDARKMKLSEEEPDEDVMAYYKWYKNDSLLFGTMMCIMPATAGGVLTPELLNKNTLTQDDVINGQDNQWQIKDHFFFLTDDQYLIVSLPSSRSIERFQTYLNYLLEDIRTSVIDVQPVLVTASDLGVKKIRSIVIGNQTIGASPELNKISTWLKSVPKELVQSILKQQDSLDEIDLDQLMIDFAISTLAFSIGVIYSSFQFFIKTVSIRLEIICIALIVISLVYEIYNFRLINNLRIDIEERLIKEENKRKENSKGK